MNYIKVEQKDRITVLTINRPKYLNALNKEVLEELRSFFKSDAYKETILVLTGQGSKAFVAGADISAMKDMTPAEAEEFSQLGQEVFKTLYQWPAPTIAAINGFALGGGCELALACDLRIMAKTAKIGQPEIALGIIPGFGGTVFVKQLIGESRAKDLIYTGRQLKAEEALQMGMVNQLAENGEECLQKAMELAENLAKKPPLALRAASLSLQETDIEAKLIKERGLFAQLFSSMDQKEGMNAFLEKRKPEFKGE